MLLASAQREASIPLPIESWWLAHTQPSAIAGIGVGFSAGVRQLLHARQPAAFAQLPGSIR